MASKELTNREELINRVNELITDERKRLERQRIEEERQTNGDLKPPTPPNEGEEGRKSSEINGSVPTGPPPEVERGLCVVCQDEEATLAVVDCGHLAMCARKFSLVSPRSAEAYIPDCSDLIMATSQECPLCRTRIVTPYVTSCIGCISADMADNGSSGFIECRLVDDQRATEGNLVSVVNLSVLYASNNHRPFILSIQGSESVQRYHIVTRVSIYLPFPSDYLSSLSLAHAAFPGSSSSLYAQPRLPLPYLSAVVSLHDPKEYFHVNDLQVGSAGID